MESAAPLRKAAIPTETVVRTTEVPGCGPVGAALAELPAWSLIDWTAVGLTETIALTGSVAEPLPCIARPQTAGASLSVSSSS